MLGLLTLSLLACKGGSSTDDTGDTAVPENGVPVVESVTLAPSPALTADSLLATVTATDPDGDTLTLSYAWQVNGQAAGDDSDTLDASLTASGDQVTVEVTASDETDSASAMSETLTVSNTPPELGAVRIGPPGASTHEELVCRYESPATDADMDSLSYAVAWTVDGVAVAAQGADAVLAGDTILASQTQAGQVWGCEITASDAVDSVSSYADITLLPGASVLVIWDVLEGGTPALVSALEAADFVVTLSDTDEISYDGTNPSLALFDAVIHLNGTTYEYTMVESGQQALVDFVDAGGGYLHTEWSAYQAGSTVTLAPLLALTRQSGFEGVGLEYTRLTEHPVVLGVPETWTSTQYCGSNTGPAVDGATTLMSLADGSAAVAVMEVGSGRVVGFAHAANYAYLTQDAYCMEDAHLQQLFVDGVLWATE